MTLAGRFFYYVTEQLFGYESGRGKGADFLSRAQVTYLIGYELDGE